jgi:plasmid stability protein
LDEKLHKFLKIRAAETSISISDLVNEAVLHELTEDMEDLAEIKKRENEPTSSSPGKIKSKYLKRFNP